MKYLFAAFFLITAGCAAYAANGQGIGTYGGPTLGVSRLALKDVPSAFYKTGFSAGVAVRIRSSQRFAVQLEFLYQQEGIRESIAPGSSTPDYDITLHYLSLPVLAKIYVDKVFNLQIGPQPAFLVAAWQTGRVSQNGTIQSNVSREITDKFSNFGLALCVGAGADLPNGLLVNLRLYYGLSSLAGGSGGLRPYSYGLTVGYLFGANRRKDTSL